MGIFNGYLKEGKGIEKDAPKKKGIFLFVDILLRKFTLLMKANTIYFLLSIPFLAISIFILAPVIVSAFGIDALISTTQTPEVIEMMTNFVIGTAVFNFFGSGPAGASYAYVCRCFTRSEHTWVWSDGWDKFKENFKNSILLAITDILVIFVLMTAIRFYSGNMFKITGSLQGICGVLQYVIYFIFAFYMLIHIFAYQIMVTYETTFKNLIKNSFIFTVVKLPACIILFVITAIFYIAIANNLGILFFIVYAVFGMSLTRFPFEFYASRVILKNIETVNRNAGQTQQTNVGETEE